MINLNKFLSFIFLVLLTFVSSVAVAREMEDFLIVRLRSLDKITARTMTFDAKVGSTVRFGNIFIKVQACRKASPVENPESTAFLQIWEEGKADSSEWIFSGWMFASSPGLSHMDHPVYDVWVLDCLEGETTEVEEEDQPTPDPAASEDTSLPDPEISVPQE